MLAGTHDAGRLGEAPEHAELGYRKRNIVPAAADQVALSIEFKSAGDDGKLARRGIVCLRGAPAQGRPDPGRQFPHAEGFAHVIVST